MCTYNEVHPLFVKCRTSHTSLTSIYGAYRYGQAIYANIELLIQICTTVEYLVQFFIIKWYG